MAVGGASVAVGGRSVKNPSNFSYVQLDPAALQALLESESGPVARDLMVRGERVKTKAKQLVGVSKPDPVPRKKPHRPGTLRDRIVKRMSIKSGKLVVEVGADVPYAFFHHEGTVAHIIRAKNSPYLVFYWSRVDRVVAFKSVNHPGTKANKFLTNALPAAKG